MTNEMTFQNGFLNQNGFVKHEKLLQNTALVLTRQHLSLHANSSAENLTIAIDEPVLSRLVNNLMYLFNIQDGDYLTFVLGQGQCANNREALKEWVLDELNALGGLCDGAVSLSALSNSRLLEMNSSDVFEHLVSQLKDQLLMEGCQ